MTWLEAVPALTVALALLLGPGLGTAALLGARGLALWAAAAPVSLGIVGTAAIAAQAANVRWGLVPMIVATSATWLSAWGVARWLTAAAVRASRARARLCDLVPALAWAGAALVLATQILYMVGAPENIAHLHDNMFHLNAARYVEESGRGSSLYLGRLGIDDAPGFYPAAWHDVVALVSGMTSAGIPASINVTNLALLCTAWPLGCMLLASRVTRRDALGYAIGAVLSTGFSSFPFLLYHFGVVYPWMTAVAVLPAFLGLIVDAVTQTSRTGSELRIASALVVVSAPGLALAHPSVLVLSMALSAPLVLTSISLAKRCTRGGRRGLFAAGYVLALVTVWLAVRPPRAPNWESIGDPGGALLRSVMVAPVGGPIPWLLVLMVMAGMVALTRHPEQMWIFWLYIFGVFLVVATNLRQTPELRWLLTGVWYSDPFRAATILTITLLPITALGAYTATSSALVWVSRSRHKTGLRAGLAILGLALLVPLVRSPAVAESTRIGHAAHQYSSTSPLLTRDELRLLRRLPRYVPEDALIAGDPLTGSALTYAFADRQPVRPFDGLDRGAAGRLVMKKLNAMRVDPSVCPSVRSLNVQFALDFGDQAVDTGHLSRIPGLQNLTADNGFTLVAQQGSAKLYRITGCPMRGPG